MDGNTSQPVKKNNTIKVLILIVLAVAAGIFFVNYLSFNSQKSKASGEVIIMRMYPFVVNKAVNNTFDVNILTQFTQTLTVSGYKFTVSFDKSKLKLTKIVYPISTSQPQTDATVDTAASYATANSEGKITVFATTSSPQTISSGSNPTFAKLTFSVIATGENTVKINTGAIFINSQGTTYYGLPVLDNHVNATASSPPTFNVCHAGPYSASCPIYGDNGIAAALGYIPEGPADVKVAAGTYEPSSATPAANMNQNEYCVININAREISLSPLSGVPIINGGKIIEQNTDRSGAIATGICSRDGNLNIRGFVIESFDYGIHTYGSFNSSSLKSNILRNNAIGIYLDGQNAVANDTMAIGASIFHSNKKSALYINKSTDVTATPLSTINVINNTFYNNGTSGSGSGIQLKGSARTTLKVRNSAFVANKTNGIEWSSGSAIDLAYNLFFNNGSSCATDVTRCTSLFNSLNNTDPKYVNLEEMDFRLSSNSPAINAGDPSIKDSDGTNSDINYYSGPGGIEGGVTSTPTPALSPTPTITPGGPTLTPSPTPTAGPTPTLNPNGVNLIMKLKFQGIVAKPSASSTMNIAVRVVGNNLDKKSTVIFTANDSGIWSGSFTSGVTAGSNYKILVKGPKHIQKKICTSIPTEDYPGTYHCEDGKITLTTGNNTLDFSGIILLAGDLPAQDGIVNSYDTSLARNNLGKNDSSALALADLNLDGVVDSQDYSMIINALSIKFDEGESDTTTTTSTFLGTAQPTTAENNSSGDLIRDNSIYDIFTSYSVAKCQSFSNSKIKDLQVGVLNLAKSYSDLDLSNKETAALSLGKVNINDFIAQDLKKGDTEVSFTTSANLTVKSSELNINSTKNLNKINSFGLSWCPSLTGCDGAPTTMTGKKYLYISQLNICE